PRAAACTPPLRPCSSRSSAVSSPSSFAPTGDPRHRHSFPTRRSSDLMNGRSRGFQLDQHTFASLTSMGVLHLYFEFFSCNPISEDRKSTRLNSSHVSISYAVFCLKKKKKDTVWLTERIELRAARRYCR